MELASIMHDYFLFAVFIIALAFEIVERRKMRNVTHESNHQSSKLYFRDSNIRIGIYVLVIISMIVEFL